MITLCCGPDSIFRLNLRYSVPVFVCLIPVCHISLRNFGSLGPKVTKTKLAWKELEEQLCILIARLALETRSFPLPEPKTEAVKIIWGLRTANSAFIALVFD